MNTIFVGGLSPEVNVQLLEDVFITFGEIVAIDLPQDEENHKGFAFIEFESADDAADAIENMHHSELNGKTLTVNVAKPGQNIPGLPVVHTKAVWDIETKIPNNLMRLWIQFNIGEVQAGKIVVVLRSDVVPKTAENFRQLCLHENGYGYKNSWFFKVVLEN